MKNSSLHRIKNYYWNEFLENSSEEAFAYLYNTHVDDLLSYGTGLGYDLETCRDALHDVFYKIFILKDKLCDVKNITYYLFRAFKNNLINSKTRDIRLVNFSEEETPFRTEYIIENSGIDNLESEELMKSVNILLDSLTPRQREAIYLKYMQNMTYEEIASMLQMNVFSARQLVHRGLTNLRDKFGDSIEGILLLFLLYKICFIT